MNPLLLCFDGDTILVNEHAVASCLHSDGMILLMDILCYAHSVYTDAREVVWLTSTYTTLVHQDWTGEVVVT